MPRRKKRKRLQYGSLAITGAERDECSLWPNSNPDDVSNWIQLQPNELVIILKPDPSDAFLFVDRNDSNYTKVLTSDGLIGWIWSEDLDILA